MKCFNMKKQTIITLLILTFSSLISSGQLSWVEENFDDKSGLRTGRIKGSFGPIPVFYLIEPKAILRDLNGGPVSFVGFDLSNADLNQVDLRNARLVRSDLSGANLNQAVLSGADLRTSNLRGTDLSVANLQSANLENADLSGADLYAADFNGADLNGAILTGVKINDTDLSASNLDGVISGQMIFDNRGGILEPITLPRDWRIIKGYLIGPKANLSGAHLSDIDLTGFNLSGADLSGADLTGTDLSNANLQGAILSGADLEGADLEGADIEGVIGLAVIQDTKDQRIARLEAQLAEYQNGRAGTILINASNGEALISFLIEESEDLKNWQKTGDKITKTIQLKDGKKFYRFALDN